MAASNIAEGSFDFMVSQDKEEDQHQAYRESFIKSESEIAMEEQEQLRMTLRKTAMRKMKISKCTKNTVFFIMICLVSGPIFFFDFPQLFEQELITYYNLDPIKVSSLYTASALPNLITTLAGSSIITSVGLGKGSVYFTGFALLGVIGCSIALHFESYVGLLFGRAVYGIGLDLAIITQATIAEKWFIGQSFSCALAMNQAITNLSTGLSYIIQPRIFIFFRSMYSPFVVYASFAFIVFLLCIVYYSQDAKHSQDLGTTVIQEEAMKVKFKLKDIRKLSWLAWLVILLFAFMHMAYYQFTNFATDCLHRRFSLSYQTSSSSLAILPLMTIPFYPIFSSFIVKRGHKAIVLVFACVLISASFFNLISLETEPKEWKVWMSLAGISLYFAMFGAAIWSSLALVVPRQAVTVVFGIGMTAINSLFVIFPLVFGFLNEKRDPESYQKSLVILLGLSLFCLLLSLLVMIIDYKTNWILDLPEIDDNVALLREKWTLDFFKFKLKE
jgi:hypothetical protein